MNSDKLPELTASSRRDSAPGAPSSVPPLRGPVEALPHAVCTVTREDIGRFSHTKRVGYYLLGRTLGEGAFAKVKEGMHFTTGEKVAVKVIDKQKAREDQYVYKNLRREAKLLQMVRHPNVIQLLEVLDTGNNYYLVTELCTGGELMEHICSNKHLDERETRRLLRQIVSAVDHLHKAGIVHRDLKVENLLLDAGRNIKIIDFGLSNIFGSPINAEVFHPNDHCHTQCGSPAYAAPELLGHKNYGPEVDVWSIGVNMYAMLTGSLPFTVEPFNISVLHAKMLDNKMNPIPDYISSGCRDLLLKLLNPRPEHRISLQDVYRHSWITSDGAEPLVSFPYPNRLSHQNLNESVLHHMTENMDLCYSEIVGAVTTNRAVKTSAIYYLLVQRLESYNKTRPKTRESFRRPTRDDYHSKQEKSASLKRRTSEQPRPFNDTPPSHEEKQLVFPQNRRMSAPAVPIGTSRHAALVQDTGLFPKSLNTTPKGNVRKTSGGISPASNTGSFRERSNSTKRSTPLRRVNTAQGCLMPLDRSPEEIPTTHDEMRKISAPASFTKPSRSIMTARPRTVSLGDGRGGNVVLSSPPDERTIPEFSSPASTPTNYHRRSNSDNFPPPIDEGLMLSKKPYPSRSRPRSLAESPRLDDEVVGDPLSQYNPNRIGSATVANRVIKTNPFFTESSMGANEILPAIASQSNRLGRRNSAKKHSKTYENGMSTILSDRSVDESMGEIMRVLTENNVDDIERKGNTVVARWNGVIFTCDVSASKPGKSTIRFSHLTGGDSQAYTDVCERLASNLLI